MKRRTFLAGLGLAVPLGLVGWWRLRQTRPGGAGGSVASGSTVAPAGTGAQAEAGGPAVASELPPLAYGPGLPIRRARQEDVHGDCAKALAVARRHIQEHCTDLGFPSGAIHGVRALGRELPLGDGDPFRTLLQTCTQETWIGGRVFLEVPARSEGHRHVMLKTLVEQQCDLELEFEHGGRRYRFRDYADSARLLLDYQPAAQPIDDHSWTIIALVRLVRPEGARWQNVQGQSVDLERMIDDTSQALLRDTQLVRDVDLGQKELPRDCAAFRRTCGGLHMLYALAAALSSGYATPPRRAELAEHLRTLVRRFIYDMRVIDQVEVLNVPRVGEEAARVKGLAARLKFLGHSLEIVGLVEQFGLHTFAAQERAAVDQAREQLCWLLASTEALRFGRYKSDQELYEGLVRDVCHAYNGLVMSPG